MLLQHCAQVFLGFSTPAFLSFLLFSSPKCKEALFILDKGIVTCMASLELAVVLSTCQRAGEIYS